MLPKWNSDSGRVLSLAFSPDGTLLASGSRDNTVGLWDARTGHLVRTLKGHSNDVNSVAFSPDSTLLASGSDDRTVRLWDARTGRMLRKWNSDSGRVLSLAFSPDGTLLANAYQYSLYLRRVRTGRLRGMRGHTKDLTLLDFSPDSELLAGGSGDRTVKLWDVRTGHLARTLEGHTGTVTSVAFSPDSAFLISGSNDCAVRIWSTCSGSEIAAIPLPFRVLAMQFGPGPDQVSVMDDGGLSHHPNCSRLRIARPKGQAC